jgi:hypothetical protein
VYGWLWRRLPGNAAVRAAIMLVLFVAVVYVLFQWVFPRLEPLLPFGEETVQNGGATPTGAPSPQPTGSPVLNGLARIPLERAAR